MQSYAAEETTFTDSVKSLVGRDVMELRSDYHLALQECAKQPDSFRWARCQRNVVQDLKPIIDFDGLFIPYYPRSLALIARPWPPRTSSWRRTPIDPLAILACGGTDEKSLGQNRHKKGGRGFVVLSIASHVWWLEICSSNYASEPVPARSRDASWGWTRTPKSSSTRTSSRSAPAASLKMALWSRGLLYF